MDRMGRAVQSAQAAKRAVVGSLPPGVRTGARDAYHRARLRFGNDPLGEPAQHQAFLKEHLGPLVSASSGPIVYLEFGVYQGASLAAAVRAFDDLGLASRSRFYGFDSFEGLPPGSEQEGWGTGWFVSSRRTTEWNLRRLGLLDRVELVEGWFDQTCTPELASRVGSASVVMFDCDIYSASATAVAFVEPLLTDPCILIFDDWLSFNEAESPEIGQVRAFAELQARQPHLEIERLGRVGHNGVGFLVRGARTSTEAAPAEPEASDADLGAAPIS